jgi:phosphatidylethanolamine-binding protein (PEBP) family uncharacterized protein
MRNASGLAWGALLFGAITLGCSSDNSSGPSSTGGASGTGGGGSGTGGTPGTGGSSGPPPCPGDPPVTEHNVCANIPSLEQGDAGFTITSPDFAYCGEIPASMTCDGRDFGTGSSPTISWSGAPAGTMSFALLFKDIAILADGDPTKDRLAYHWVMWDIPAATQGLPAGMTGGYHSTEVPGAVQWSGRNQYAFFPPCPNPFPKSDARFTCSLVIDSYSFTLYALPMATLDSLPAPDLDPTSNMPTGNWVVKMGHYIESLPALGVTEYRGTSHAWASSFAPPPAEQYPCAQDMIASGMTSTCLQ